MKFLIYFDTFDLHKNIKCQYGGSQQEQKPSNSSNINSQLNEIDKENEGEAESRTEQIFGDSITLLFTEIKEAVIYALKSIQQFGVNWILVPVLFASVSPAMPFFLVMSVLAAILKYIMWHFRKL